MSKQNKFEAEARKCLRLVKADFPGARLASGAPADCGSSKSDVDILVYHEGVTVEERITKMLLGREVNILISGPAKPYRLRALKHRKIELQLTRKFPEKAELVGQMKELGTCTERAWADVLDMNVSSDAEAYDAMASLKLSDVQHCCECHALVGLQATMGECASCFHAS